METAAIKTDAIKVSSIIERKIRNRSDNCVILIGLAIL
jgi:hypothetical protein